MMMRTCYFSGLEKPGVKIESMRSFPYSCLPAVSQAGLLRERAPCPTCWSQLKLSFDCQFHPAEHSWGARGGRWSLGLECLPMLRTGLGHVSSHLATPPALGLVFSLPCFGARGFARVNTTFI